MTEVVRAKRMPNPIVMLTIILFMVSAITSGVLGLTNVLTKERIAQQDAAKKAAAYAEVLPAAAAAESVDFDRAAFPIVNSISRMGEDGYVVELSFSGAQSTLTAAVGIDPSGTVTGVSIIKHAETSGLGAKASESSFRDQYIGAAEHVSLTKSGGTIEGISGATITSTAVTSAVNTAMDAVASLG